MARAAAARGRTTARGPLALRELRSSKALPRSHGAAHRREAPKRPEWRAGGSLEAGPYRGLTALADFWWSARMLDPFVFVDADGRVLSGDTPERASLDLGVNASLARWIPADLRVRVDNALNRR